GGASGTMSPGGNPAASNPVTGSGWLGEQLGVNRNGWRFGGLNITDANGQFTGGLDPGKWTGDSLTLLDLSIDMDQFRGIEGGLFGIQLLAYGGGSVNQNAGAVLGYNALDVTVPPLTRTELYQLWYRQELFDNRLILRAGKLVPTIDFNNVIRPVRSSDPTYQIPAVTSVLFTPAYLSPTMLGIMPGYYNSSTGTVATAIPTENSYFQYGLFDGNLAAGRNTGQEGPHFNGYNLHLVETGAHWKIGSEKKPGQIGAGYWKQTGLLSAPGGYVRGAQGIYMFGSQQIYFERAGESNNGLVAWGQFAATDSPFIATHRYFGLGLTYFGPLPGRDNDSAGFGLAYGKMNTNPAANLGKQELNLTWYYQCQVRPNCFIQPNMSYIASPAAQPGLKDVVALTLRAMVLF
ncbi:MAG TPA: carbohydrate porin, partial [Candidatus Saccharimonadales bacterium]|nr:carbohydrate porin [Candidatus Saccharimonadales bacterium]